MICYGCARESGHEPECPGDVRPEPASFVAQWRLALEEHAGPQRDAWHRKYEELSRMALTLPQYTGPLVFVDDKSSGTMRGDSIARIGCTHGLIGGCSVCSCDYEQLEKATELRRAAEDRGEVTSARDQAIKSVIARREAEDRGEVPYEFDGDDTDDIERKALSSERSFVAWYEQVTGRAKRDGLKPCKQPCNCQRCW